VQRVRPGDAVKVVPFEDREGSGKAANPNPPSPASK
jgi:hypothetical protein